MPPRKNRPIKKAHHKKYVKKESTGGRMSMEGFEEHAEDGRTVITDVPCLSSYKTGLFSLNAKARGLVEDASWAYVRTFLNSTKRKLLVVPTDDGEGGRKLQIGCQFTDIHSRRGMRGDSEDIEKFTDISVAKTKHGVGIVISY